MAHQCLPAHLVLGPDPFGKMVKSAQYAGQLPGRRGAERRWGAPPKSTNGIFSNAKAMGLGADDESILARVNDASEPLGKFNPMRSGPWRCLGQQGVGKELGKTAQSG